MDEECRVVRPKYARHTGRHRLANCRAGPADQNAAMRCMVQKAATLPKR
jgi:hypothetical protein